MRHNHKEMQKKMSAKISKILKEGIRGKKVSRKQAIAVAASILGISKKKKGRKIKKKK